MREDLSDIEKKQELYTKCETIVKMQLSLGMDSIHAKKYWQAFLPSVEPSVLADVLAMALGSAGHQVMKSKS
ncbi:hypothetical protein CBG25_05805 [Arsenophonus sp. ENCA]|uniref:hypothetical protein n=1 Tax=Arsenophonus sp. ENCA TaxID=1987579 RepID=UPI000BDBF7A4|nr:hypothetical protein [Arsenophonus sp. ENCA]PAV06484.1 hypothetical protein CBG25_05805 [Arsenophonus sp. ENCA]